ncbi:MAG: hypothetical protein HFJ17_02125 [Clostridia bacterium]|nr:hypothetical protein [Clostridia bacterium]
MSNKSKNIIEKIVKKDYNNELEEVLSSKPYTEDVKNLLLDILYKVETSYKDYETVKRNVLPKEEYIKNIIRTIKNECKNIETIKTDLNTDKEETKNFIINKEKKEIKCYPILVKLLYTISAIRKNENIVDVGDGLLNKTITDLINTGNNINTVEPLRDFNGFSWNVITNDIESLYYNIVYQDLIILNGNKFFEQWANNADKEKDYMELLRQDLKKKYEEESEQIIELIKVLSVLIEINMNTSIIKDIYNEKSRIEEELNNLQNSEKYIIEISEKRKSLIKKIKRIDITINNKELLVKEYKRRNSLLKDKNKIFSPKVLVKRLKEERKLILKKIEEYTYLMNPKNIINHRSKLEEQLKYRNLVDIDNIDAEIVKNIILLQKIVIKCMKKRIKNCTTKNEAIDIMYQLRYLSMVPIKEKQTIGDLIELEKDFKSIKREIFVKASVLKLINNILDNDKLNVEIYSYIFKTRIISLEEISLKIAKMKDGWYVQFFDEGVTDEAFKIELDLKKENIKIKVNKKVNLFG